MIQHRNRTIKEIKPYIIILVKLLPQSTKVEAGREFRIKLLYVCVSRAPLVFVQVSLAMHKSSSLVSNASFHRSHAIYKMRWLTIASICCEDPHTHIFVIDYAKRFYLSLLRLIKLLLNSVNKRLEGEINLLKFLTKCLRFVLFLFLKKFFFFFL